MSTVVYFVEFVAMSLVGILSYKLYASYVRWKSSSAYCSSVETERVTHDTLTTSVDLPKDENAAEIVNAPQLKVSLPQAVREISTSQVDSKLPTNQNEMSVEKKPSAILDDYIGEFFLQQPIEDRVTREPNYDVEVLATIDEAQALDVEPYENKYDGEFIKVESLIMPDAFVQPSCDEDVPILREYSDIETDAFITVVATNNEIKNTNNKIMSDKVVMAMLDEAKLVRAS